MNGLYIDSVRLARPISEDSYLKEIPAVKWLIRNKVLALKKPVTILVGENGSGKSTLIEAIALASGFNPEGGTYNMNFQTENSYSDLWEHLRIGRLRRAKDGFFLRAESFYNLASYIDIHDRDPESGQPILPGFGGISLHAQSHGESFLAMVQNRLGGHGLYLFDEPEAALSPSRILTLIAEIDRLVKNDSQFIISTHSPILMAFPDAEVLELSSEGIRSVDYRETEHFTVTKQFVNDPERMLHYLLSE